VGDAWLGKTRLLDELRQHNQDHSITTISAHGYRAERELPYGVVSQLLASLVGLSVWPAFERETSELVLSEAARIHPVLGVPTPVSDGDVLGETRLYDAVLKLLTATPKVRMVDDINGLTARRWRFSPT